MDKWDKFCSFWGLGDGETVYKDFMKWLKNKNENNSIVCWERNNEGQCNVPRLKEKDNG